MVKSRKRKKNVVHYKRRHTVRHRARSSNPAKHHRRRTTYHPVKRRRHNPQARVHHYRRHRYSHNPFSMGGIKDAVVKVLYLAGGGVGTRSIPQLLAPTFNTGFVGYAMNLVTASILGWSAKRFAGDATGMTFYGGLAFTIARMIDDFTGIQLLQFSAVNPGGSPLLSGDAGYGVGLGGTFVTQNLPMPVNSQGDPQAALPAGSTSDIVPVMDRSWAQNMGA